MKNESMPSAAKRLMEPEPTCSRIRTDTKMHQWQQWVKKLVRQLFYEQALFRDLQQVYSQQG
jgi:hypothetical protein